MNKDCYYPKPIDTSDVVLPDELNELVELLARNVHDNWALGRINDGWTYGSVRDDVLKQHPCLVDYSELFDREKVYDRNTALETLKTIVKLGYCIQKFDSELVYVRTKNKNWL